LAKLNYIWGKIWLIESWTLHWLVTGLIAFSDVNKLANCVIFTKDKTFFQLHNNNNAQMWLICLAKFCCFGILILYYVPTTRTCSKQCIGNLNWSNKPWIILTYSYSFRFQTRKKNDIQWLATDHYSVQSGSWGAWYDNQIQLLNFTVVAVFCVARDQVIWIWMYF
jgi:hypothetical protein